MGTRRLGGHPKPAIDGHLNTGHHTAKPENQLNGLQGRKRVRCRLVLHDDGGHQSPQREVRIVAEHHRQALTTVAGFAKTASLPWSSASVPQLEWMAVLLDLRFRGALNSRSRTPPS
jgi:hypothetical protein